MPDPGNVPGKFLVSPHNFADEVLAQYRFPERVLIYDSTLRKLDNQPGSLSAYRVSLEDRLEIAAALDEAGVHSVGFNPLHFRGRNPVLHRLVTDTVRAIASRGFRFEIDAVMDFEPWWENGTYQENVDALVDLGVDLIRIAVPPLMYARSYPEWSWEKLRDRPVPVMEYIQKRGLRADVHLPELARTDLEQLIQLVNYWVDHGVDTLSFSDQFGTLAPQAMSYVFRKLTQAMTKQVPMILHCHNAFGMATASVIAAAAHGVSPEVAVNGIGDRVGLADIVPVVMSLELLYDVRTGIKLEKLAELSALVERITGMRIEPKEQRPVLGELHLPTRDSTFIELMRSGSWSSYPFVPGIVGQDPPIVWWEGRILTEASVKAKIAQLGLTSSEEQVSKVLQAIRQRLRALSEFPAWLHDDEVGRICRETLAN